MARIAGAGWFALPNTIFEVAHGPYELAVLAYLQRCAGPDGAAWPSERTIARMCHLSTGQAHNVLRMLMERRVIRLEERGNGHRSSVYFINLFQRSLHERSAHVVIQNNTHEQDPVVAVSSNPSVSLSVIGKSVQVGEEGFVVGPELQKQWIQAYPAIDVPQEVSRAFAWVQANPKHRKSNWQRFLVNWLARSQDRARPGWNGETPEQRKRQILEAIK